MSAHSQANGQTGSHAEQVADAARKLLTREVGFLEGVRALVALGYEPNGYDYAPSFEFIFWLNAVSAHLPDQAIREQCDPEFWMRSEDEVKQLESQYGDRINQACRALLIS